MQAEGVSGSGLPCQRAKRSVRVPVGPTKKPPPGRGNPGKDAMIPAARARGLDPQDDNEADALALLAWAVSQEVAS